MKIVTVNNVVADDSVKSVLHSAVIMDDKFILANYIIFRRIIIQFTYYKELRKYLKNLTPEKCLNILT